MDKDRWTSVTIDDLATIAKVGGFDLTVAPPIDSSEGMALADNPLGNSDERIDLLKELALCAVTKPPECFVDMVDENMERLLRMSYLESEVSDILVEGLRIGVSKKCGASACMLGAFYYDGTFVEQNYESAAELYELGAEWGSIQAMINLGYIYEYGRIGERDCARAYQCYSQAAALSQECEALYKMGDLISQGKGVEQDRPVAVKLWSMAWDDALGPAMRAQAAIRLAPLYLKGDSEVGIDQDALTALMMYQTAEIGLRQDIAKGLTYYEKRLAEAIDGQAEARSLLDVLTEQ